MNTYETMSDFEINTAVTALVNDCSNWGLNETEFYHCGIDGSGYYSQPILDYCNDPLHAWPVIADNEISLMRDTSTNDVWEAVYKGWHTTCGFQSRVSPQGHYICENPLRAAMIVYLMMSDNS